MSFGSKHTRGHRNETNLILRITNYYLLNDGVLTTKLRITILYYVLLITIITIITIITNLNGFFQPCILSNCSL